MSDIQLEDLVYTYPNQTDPRIQTLISGKYEFAELASSVTEPVPNSGELYKHQELIKRYMVQYDRLLLIHQTGTGKSCAGFGAAEQFKIGLIDAMVSYVDMYVKPERTNIKRVYFLTKGPTLLSEAKYQLVCRCTGGTYLTEQVVNSISEKARKGNLTREIKKFYSMKTYGDLSGKIIKENLTDDQIREKYSGSLFIVDEVQNLHVDTEEPSTRTSTEDENKPVYDQLWRVFHLVERSKIILLSATPMINNVNEIAAIMNLILPRNQQMSLSDDYTTKTTEELEPYFRGRVSYVRSLDTGAIPQYVGETINYRHELGGEYYQSQVIVYPSIMSEHQMIGYEQAEQSPGAFDQRLRQAANFVFPDGSFGTEGFNRYVEKVGTDDYRANDQLYPYLQSYEYLQILSKKFESIVRICKTEPGNCFCYSDFLAGSGAAILALCFQSLGFEPFMETSSIFIGSSEGRSSLRPYCTQSASDEANQRVVRITPKLRYALLTSDTSKNENRLSSLLEAFNSYENRHGDYIKVLIGSPVTKVGINLSNVVQIHLIGPAWNQANIYQSISRAIRSTSHVALIEEERRMLSDQGLDPDQATVPVKIYQHASVTPDGKSVDINRYLLAEQKDIQIKRMERIMKRIAIDCQIHYNRNVRSTDVDFTPICDYDECQYVCYSPPPSEIDFSSFDSLYSSSYVQTISNQIKSIISIVFTLSYDQLLTYFENVPSRYIYRAISDLIGNKVPIIDRYGFTTYLREDGDRIFISKEYPSDSTLSLPISIYSSNLIASNKVTLHDYLSSIQLEQQSSVIDRIFTYSPDDPQFDSLINNLTIDVKVKLLENSLTAYGLNGVTDNPSINAIIDKFRAFVFAMHEPVEQIQRFKYFLSMRGKGRGRKPKSNIIRSKKINPVEPGPAPELPTDTELVYIHNLYTQEYTGVSYAVTAKFSKADGRIRILKPSENVGFRDANPYEIPVYNEILQRQTLDRISSFEQYPIYGTILSADGKFRIRDKTTENISDVASDARRQNRGQVCRTWLKPNLIEVLWKLGYESPVHIDTSVLTDLQLETYLQREGVIEKIPLSTFDRSKMEFFYKWYASGFGRDHICKLLQDHLESIGRLLII